MSGDGDAVVLKRIGTSVGVNGVSCGSAAIGTTSKIAITGTVRHQQLTLDLSAGAFSPAFTSGPRRGRSSAITIAAALYPDTPVVIIGTPGNDNIVAGRSGISLDRDASVDMTIGAGRLARLDGGAGDDRLWAGGGNGIGGPLRKALTISGGEGADSLVGGDGSDTLSDGPGADGAIGGAGDDVFIPGPGDDGYSGGDGNDTLKATSAQDGKNDAFHGDAGIDTADFSARTKRVCLELVRNWACDGGPEDQFSSVEVLIGGSGNDTLLGLTGDPVHLIGGPGNDRLWGGGGDDVLEGGAGNDAEYGDLGNDLYVEGAAPNGSDDLGLVVVLNCVNIYGCAAVGFGPDSGTDTVDYSARTGPVDVSLDTFQNDGQAGENDNVHTGIEIVRGGSGDDKLTGGNESVSFYGNAGNDVLTGGSKQDQLHGGAGDDTFKTVDGFQDFIFTGAGIDNVSLIDVGLDVVSHGD